ncbi:MAG: HAD-IIIA family hydrolase [Actinomycetota bacterium]|nr:HAD-IIIA family hydrolase [Actinomycetota bacterium]
MTRRPVAGRGVPLRAILFDRDDTLIENVPYNGDPARVVPLPGARAAIQVARSAGLLTGVVTNQSGIGRGLLTSAELMAVNARVDQLLGPFDAWQHCPHTPWQGCACRKPAPGMVLAALQQLGVSAAECALVGDAGSDIRAAGAAGVRAVLCPGPQTTLQDRQDAPHVCRDVTSAVQLLIGLGSPR